MSMTRGTVWLSAEDDATREQLQQTYARRHKANGLEWEPRVLREMILSEACARGLQAMADEKLPPASAESNEPSIAQRLQALFNRQEAAV